MISINYQTYGKGLNIRLRLYQDGETRFINVNGGLHGNLLKKHWNVKRKCFYPSAPFSEENNKFLYDFKRKYDERAATWGGSLFGFLESFKEEENVRTKPTVHEAFAFIIAGMKERNVNPDGTISGGYEGYEKADKRFREFCVANGMDYLGLLLEDVTPQLVNRVLAWVKAQRNKKCMYMSASLKSLLNKSMANGWMERKDFSLCNWEKKSSRSVKKYESLTEEQCSMFRNFSLSELPRGPHTELYRDFCLFILYTCQSVCDAVALQYSDIRIIDGKEHFIFKRRKIADKQSVECSVPINSEMRRIMQRWKNEAKDGYVFPVRSKERLARNKVNNGDIKKFISKLNTWLRKVGPMLGCTFTLHSYVFRHTGITRYVSSGVNPLYLANLAGTSVRNCEKIYYNNHGDTRNRDMVLQAMLI